MAKDLYSILGVSRDASDKDIKRAYRKIAQQNHPDVNPDNPAAEERFKEAAAAFDVIGSSDKRALYDEFGPDGLREGFNADAARRYGTSAGFGAGGPGGFDDILSQLFGGGGSPFGGGGSPFGGGGSPFGGGFNRAPQRGAHIEVTLKISLAEAVNGCKKKLMGYGVDVKVRPNVTSGQTLRLKGKGQAGPGGHGDLKVHIMVNTPDGTELEHEEKGHLRLPVPISLVQAVKGGKVAVDLPEGGEIKLNLPSNLTLPKRMRIPHRGMTTKNERGHLYVMPYIVPPTKPAEEEDQETFNKLIEALEIFYNAGESQ